MDEEKFEAHKTKGKLLKSLLAFTLVVAIYKTNGVKKVAVGHELLFQDMKPASQKYETTSK